MNDKGVRANTEFKTYVMKSIQNELKKTRKISIATIATNNSNNVDSTRIITSDKDLMQLVSDCVFLYDGMKDKKIHEAGVLEKFGVKPSQVVDVQSLMGDSTDNVPGVPGIGPKKAA